MSSTRALLSDKALCVSQSERALYGNFIPIEFTINEITDLEKWIWGPVSIVECNDISIQYKSARL